MFWSIVIKILLNVMISPLFLIDHSISRPLSNCFS
nr:MAG TPA: hypothetical protein [Caudoviricetes sp.]